MTTATQSLGKTYGLGLLAVLIFAMTIPMTRMANGAMASPQLPPLFVGVGRSAVGGMLALVYLIWVRATLPTATQWRWLMGVVVGGVLAFPLGMGWAVRHVPAAHASVITGVLPLTTAMLASALFRQQPGRLFWILSTLGAGLVLVFMQQTSAAVQDGTPLGWLADAALVPAMLGASLAYVSGAVLARQMPAAQTISWALVAALPVTLPLSLDWWPEHAAATSSWLALGYVSTMSTWIGFFAWYAALARDPIGVSQIQLLQPFASIGLAALILGEQVSGMTWGFALAVLLVVWLGNRCRLGRTT